MFVKLRDNSEDVLAVNLNTGVRIKLLELSKTVELVIQADEIWTTIESYPTRTDALQAFECIMDRIEAERPVCDVDEL